MTSQQKITMNNLNKKNTAKNYHHPLTGTQHYQLTANHHWLQTENQCQPTENNHRTTTSNFMLLRICNIWYQGLKTDVLWNFYGYKSKIAPFLKMTYSFLSRKYGNCFVYLQSGILKPTDDFQVKPIYLKLTSPSSCTIFLPFTAAI